MPEQKPKVTIRMYCHGFGDCFLLTFDNRGTPYRILIDCGMLTGNSNTLKTAIRNIHDELRLPDGKQSKIDVVVQTHEHKDHISGFNLRDEAGNLLWDSIKVGQVWQAWTEDPDHCLASELKEKQLKKKKALDKALELYLENITSGHHVSLMADQYNGDIYLAAEQRYANALKQLLEFNHTADEVRTNNEPGRRSQSFTKKKPSRRTVKNAMDYFSERDPNEKIVIKYFRPGDLVGKNETGLHGVKFYVLGPPEDYKKLRVMDDPKHEEMYLEGHGPSENFFMALTGDNDGSIEHVSPFSKKYFYREEDLKNGKASLSSLQGDTRKKTKKAKASDVFDSYYDEDQAWRQIDIDWLHNTGLLALHLDSYTNNTSLVLAIELETDDDNKERVLLFPGDAQIGNWLTWTEKNKDTGIPKLQWEVKRSNGKAKITAEDLLNRTVFYKVGHHASHNATARKNGLELMNHDELVAMIPVDEQVAANQGKRGWEMPAKELYQRLIEKTRGRLIRVDQGIIIQTQPDQIPLGAQLTDEQLEDFSSKVSESEIKITTDAGEVRPLYYEYRIY